MEDFNPVVILDDGERGSLSAIIGHPGFKVFQKLFKSVVDSFTIRLMNTSSVDEKSVLIMHRNSQVAAQLYTALINRINQETEMHVKAPRLTDKPIDPAEVLDIGDFVTNPNDYEYRLDEETF